MNDVEKPHEIEYLEAQVQAAQNGQTAAMAQAETWKTTAEFYNGKAAEYESSLRSAIHIIGCLAFIIFLFAGFITYLLLS